MSWIKQTITTKTCPVCNGSGGFYAATDCEVYDDWQDCTECDGSGEVEDE